MVDAKEEDFELVVLDDIPALFTNSRVDRGSIPDGAYCYDVRHDDCCQGIACEIKPHIMVNHWGTIIAKQEIPLEDGSYYPKEDLNYLGRTMTLDEFLQADINQDTVQNEQGEQTAQLNM